MRTHRHHHWPHDRNRKKTLAEHWDNLNALQKTGLVGAFATAVAGMGALVYTNFLSLDAQLERWNPDYTELCHSFDEDSELHNRYNRGGEATDRVSRIMNQSYIGKAAMRDLANDNATLCIGPTKENPEAVLEPLSLHNITVMNEDYSAADHARAFTYQYAVKATKGTSDWSADYVPGDALFWQRARTANMYVAYIDNMYQESGKSFESSIWRGFKNSASNDFSEIINAYQTGMRADSESSQFRRIGARQAAFKAVMDSSLVLRLEEDFLEWYRRELNDVSRQQSYPCLDMEGHTKLCNRTVWDPPPRRRNSMELPAETVVQMSNAMFADRDGYMDSQFVIGFLQNDYYSTPQTPEGREWMEKIEQRIDRCCDRRRDDSRAYNGIDSLELRFK